MKQVKILRGPSGSGKTTWTKKLADKLAKDGIGVTVVSADHFFESTETSMGDVGVHEHPVYNFDVTKLPEAHQYSLNAFLRALLEEHPVIVVDNTNERRWEYMNYEMAAKLAGYEIEIVEFVCETIGDVRTCARRSAHRVPLAVTAKKAVFMEEDRRATRIPIEGV